MLTSCASEFKKLRQTEISPCPLSGFKPAIDYALYESSVDVLNKHLSGLLVIKTMPDQSTRAVFQSEMGMTYFDFEWSAEGIFAAKSVIPQMDKKVVVTALRKDFELMLMNTLDTAQAITFTDGSLLYSRFSEGKEFIYAVSDTLCSSLVKMERASRRKAKVDVYLYGGESIPDSVWMDHTQFKFTISLKRISQ